MYKFHHTEDIDRSSTSDVDTLDEQMRLMVNRTVRALDKLPRHDTTFGSLTETIFRTFISTHKSIRLLLKEAGAEPDYAPDAMSLVREQVEKVFVITLLLDDPQKWILVYFKDDWRRFYEYDVLLNGREQKDLPGFEFDNAQKNRLRILQNNASVSELEKEWLEFKFYNPGSAIPSHLKGSSIPEFPTPGKVKENMNDKSAEEFLVRLHKEYKRICGYSHVGLDKLQIVSMRVVPNRLSESHKDVFLEQALIRPAMWTSYLTVACACTEAYKYLQQYDPDISRTAQLLDILYDFWAVLRQQSLIGKVFWGIRAKRVLPPLLQ